MADVLTPAILSPLLVRVRKALDEIRPYLLADGGDVELVNFNDGVVTVSLKGRCSGCPMSTQTLRLGIEKHLKERVPEVTSVEQDRSADAAPSVMQKQTAPEMNPERRATQFLRADHSRLKWTLNKLDAAVATLASSSERERSMGLNILRQARQTFAGEFCDHMRREEEILFPALKPIITWGDPTAALMKEHDLLRAEIERFGNAIVAWEIGGSSHLFGVAGRLSRMLRDHLFREENTLYFEADESLPDEVVRQLLESAKCMTHAS